MLDLLAKMYNKKLSTLLIGKKAISIETCGCNFKRIVV